MGAELSIIELNAAGVGRGVPAVNTAINTVPGADVVPVVVGCVVKVVSVTFGAEEPLVVLTTGDGGVNVVVVVVVVC